MSSFHACQCYVRKTITTFFHYLHHESKPIKIANGWIERFSYSTKSSQRMGLLSRCNSTKMLQRLNCKSAQQPSNHDLIIIYAKISSLQFQHCGKWNVNDLATAFFSGVTLCCLIIYFFLLNKLFNLYEYQTTSINWKLNCG